jgi:hypothetical protein
MFPMNHGKSLVELFKGHTRSVSVVTGSIITLFLIPQIKWGYGHAFREITSIIALASIAAIFASVLYLLLVLPVLRKATRLETGELLNKLSTVHMPIYLFWLYIVGCQLGVNLFTKYLLIIVPALCLVSLVSLFIKYPLPVGVFKQIPYLEISIFSSIIAITLSYFFYQARLGLENSMTRDVVKSLGISLLLINFPFFISFFQRVRSSEERLPWYRSYAFTTLLLLSTVTLVGFMIQDQSTHYFDTALSIAGYSLFLLSALGYISFTILSSHITKNAFFLSLFFVFSLWVTGIIWGTGYFFPARSQYWVFLNPLFVERIYVGGAHLDTLFHASISQMIETYGIPSTGLDGLPYLHYHFGSHWIFAQFSKLIHMDPINFYPCISTVPYCSLWS